MWFGKRKDERAQDKEPRILGWTHGDLCYGSATVWQSFPKSLLKVKLTSGI